MAQSYFHPKNMLGPLSPAQDNFPRQVIQNDVNVDAVQDAYIERKDKLVLRVVPFLINSESFRSSTASYLL